MLSKPYSYLKNKTSNSYFYHFYCYHDRSTKHSVRTGSLYQPSLQLLYASAIFTVCSPSNSPCCYCTSSLIPPGLWFLNLGLHITVDWWPKKTPASSPVDIWSEKCRCDQRAKESREMYCGKHLFMLLRMTNTGMTFFFFVDFWVRIWIS